MATLCRLMTRPVRSGTFFFRPFCSKGPQITSVTEEGASLQESAQPNDSDDVLVPGFGAVTPKYPRKYVQLPSNPCKTDYRRREMVAKYEAKRTMLQAIVHDINIPYDIRCHYQQKLTKLPRNTSRTRVRNRCTYSGRPRAVYRRFRMSRICFRRAASFGEVMGVRKSSW